MDPEEMLARFLHIPFQQQIETEIAARSGAFVIIDGQLHQGRFIEVASQIFHNGIGPRFIQFAFGLGEELLGGFLVFVEPG